ncbi:Tigger transposable element-derived protein 6 [Folsomia candida]|uniref:Tigger transposable element-derived protein 6 n=1 Tax=Folsomia candida TaxID=158441 RepID=A0A226DTZ6_FOLCA|nr:Tigger transposable element-derived protein 6 [Folsomia candida]
MDSVNFLSVSKALVEIFKQQNFHDCAIYDIDLRRWGLLTAAEYEGLVFKGSKKWLASLKTRNGISSRRIQKLVSKRAVRDMDQITATAALFRQQMKSLIPKFLPSNILNTDQTGFNYEMTSTRTLSWKGERKTLGSANSPTNKVTHSYTVQYVIAYDGTIFDKVVEQSIFPAVNVHTTASKSGKLSISLVEEFIKEVLRPNLDTQYDYLYLIDNWGGQTNIELYSSLLDEDNSFTVKLIPENTTDLCQPLDTYFHRQLKYLLKQFSAYELLNEYEKPSELSSRNGAIKLHSLAHFILSAPVLKPMDSQSSGFSGVLLVEQEMRERGLKVSPGLFRKSFTPNVHPKLSSVQEVLPEALVPANPQASVRILGNPPSPNTQSVDFDVALSSPRNSQGFLEFEENLPADTRQTDLGVSPSELKKYYNFNLESVLLENEAARRVIKDKIPAKMFVIREDRQAICSVLVDAFIQNLGRSPSKQAMQQLAVDLVNKYPLLGDPRRKNLGAEMWYFNSAHSQGSTGFLEERIKNQRKKLTKKKIIEKTVEIDIYPLPWDSEFDEENPEPDEKTLEYLRQNRGADIIDTMKSTVFMRRTVIRDEIKDNLAGFRRIPAIIPRLFDMQGTKALRRNKTKNAEWLKKPVGFGPSKLLILTPEIKNTHVADILSENRNAAPFILSLGSTYDLKIESFFVILDKFAIPCGSCFLLALDTCLKSFTVFYFPPPVEYKNVWQFLHGIAGNPCDSLTLTPIVQALIGQIIPRID